MPARLNRSQRVVLALILAALGLGFAWPVKPVEVNPLVGGYWLCTGPLTEPDGAIQTIAFASSGKFKLMRVCSASDWKVSEGTYTFAEGELTLVFGGKTAKVKVEMPEAGYMLLTQGKARSIWAKQW